MSRNTGKDSILGKESKLRHPEPDNGTRYSYPNGDRKYYDRDACPSGFDEHVWHLVLYFEQLSEEAGFKIPGRPVVYTELYHRIQDDPDLNHLIDDSLARTRVNNIYNISLIEDMITTYVNDTDNFKVTINDFCSKLIFSYYKSYIHDSRERELLLSKGSRVKETEIPVGSSRRTEEEKEIARIKLGNRTMEESLLKMRRFKEGE